MTGRACSRSENARHNRPGPPRRMPPRSTDSGTGLFGSRSTSKPARVARGTRRRNLRPFRCLQGCHECGQGARFQLLAPFSEDCNVVRAESTLQGGSRDLQESHLRLQAKSMFEIPAIGNANPGRIPARNPGFANNGLRRAASAEPGAPPAGDVGYFVSAIRFASAAWTKRGFSLVASASDASAFDRYPSCL